MITTRQIVRRWAWGTGIAVVFLLVLWKVETVSTLLLLSFMGAYVLNPVVTRLARVRFINRTGATLIVLLSLLVGFSTVLFIIIPEMVVELHRFMERLPGYMDALKLSVAPWMDKNMGIHMPLSFREAMMQSGREIDDLFGLVTGMSAQLFSGTRVAFGAVVGTLMFPLFLFFLLKDFPSILGALDALVPMRNRERFHVVMREIDGNLSAFLHGQFTVMLILGFLYSLGYLCVGVPVAIGVGLLTGMLCFVPYVGAGTGFILALLFSLLEYQGWSTVLGVAAVFAAVQFFDGAFITPNVLGGKLGLGPLWIIVALMTGGELFGFLGVLLAVPTVAVMKVLVTHAIERYKRSSLYTSMDKSMSFLPDDGGADPPEETP